MNIKEKFAKFMYGRYGTDRLNMFLLIVLMVCAVGNLFVRNAYFSVLLTSWEFLLIIFGCFPEIFQSGTLRIRSIWLWKTVSADFLERISTFSSREKNFISIPALSVNRKSEFRKEREK